MKTRAEKKTAKPRRRKSWRRMTQAQRAVAVAKDVLLQLKLRKFTARTGEYFKEVNGRKANFSCTIKPGHTCQACAKGGLMIARMKLTRSVPDAVRIKSGDSIPSNWRAEVFRSSSGKMVRRMGERLIVNSLADCFGEGQLDRIEVCFEAWMNNIHGISPEVVGLYSPLSPEKRMRGIMGNIIRHKGVFVPSAGPIFVRVKLPKRGIKKTKGRAKARA